MKIDKSRIDEKWFDYKDIKIKIKPFPTVQGIFFPESEIEIAEAGLKKFLYCVVNWEGIIDVDDNPLECNDENKQFIYNYCDDISSFVLVKVHSFDIVLNSEIKN